MKYSSRKRKEFEAYALAELRRIRKRLLLEHYELPEMAFKENTKFLGIVCNYPYVGSEIQYGEYALDTYFERKDYQYLKDSFRHEMIHLIVEPLYQLATRPKKVSSEELRNTVEQVVEHLTQVTKQ